jgi:hypothetical protein
MGIVSWGTDWDRVKLGGKVIPGVVHVSVKLPSCLDKRKGHGRKRSKPKDKGQPSAEVKLKIRLGAGDIQAFEQDIVPLLKPPSKTKPQDPLTIVSRECAVWGINLVNVDSIDSKPPEPGGPKWVEVGLAEYEAEPAALAKPKDKPKDKDDGWTLPEGHRLPPSQASKTGRLSGNAAGSPSGNAAAYPVL